LPDTGFALVQILTLLLVAGRPVSTELLEELKPMAGTCSRRHLARHLCPGMSWRSPSGTLPLMSARLALKELADQGHLTLPPAGPGPQRNPRPERVNDLAEIAPLACSLAELGELEIVVVDKSGSALSKQWNELMRQHYLGPGPLCGAQLRYLVRSAQGPVAALSFSAAARRLRGRDLWIGWSEMARRENLHLVVNHSRFLILRHVQVPNLASYLLPRVLARLADVETRRLGNGDRLEGCLGIDMVVAWRIYHLTKLGREAPTVPGTVYFEEHEWQALVALVTRQPEPPKEPPTLREAVRLVAGLGGFLGRKGDGEPGTETLWRGLQRLDDIAEAYLVLRSAPTEGPVSSDGRYG
jgi:hypothetical protein